MARPVLITEKRFVGKTQSPPTGYTHIHLGPAIFHQFGLELFEQEEGSVSFTVAIIEWPDGKVGSVPVDWCRFTDKEK